MTERMIETAGAVLATQSFGDPETPTVLLTMGAMASMLWWPEDFCARLAARGRHVIRYDNRDTGLSTFWPPGAPGYTGDDMADDAVRILDGYDVEQAHLVGMSMGGMLAQMVALSHPARVVSLTVISASPLGEDTSDLPGATAEYREHARRFESLDWADRTRVIDLMVADSAILAGPAHPFDAAWHSDLITRDYDRSRSFASGINHFALDGGEAFAGRLRELVPPLLVVHGTADPLFPLAHGQALAAAVPGSTLLALEGGGHALHPANWNRIIDAIANHSRC